MEFQVIVQVRDNRFGCAFVEGQRLSLRSMYVIEEICGYRERILNKKGSIPTTAISQHDFRAAAIFRYLLIMNALKLGIAGRNRDHPENMALRAYLWVKSVAEMPVKPLHC